ncbi:hypothetical protein SAVIM40S_08285 [Streptomyces avidinii]
MVGYPVGPDVQLGEGHPLAVGDDRRGVGRTGDLRLEQPRQRRGTDLHRRVVPLAHDPVQPSFVQDLQCTQRYLGPTVQCHLQRRHQVLGGRTHQHTDREAVYGSERVHGQRQPTVSVVVDRDRERVVGPLTREHEADAVGIAHLGPGGVLSGLLRRVAAGVVPVVEEGGEQRRLTRDPAGALRHGERRVLVLQQVCELVAHRGDRAQHTEFGGAHAYRKRVDQRTGDPVGADPRVHPAEQDRAEDHVVTAGDRGQCPGPRHVQNGGCAHAQSTCHLAQPRPAGRSERYDLTHHV